MNKIYFERLLQRNPYIGCKLCTHECECVGTKFSSLTEGQVSRICPLQHAEDLSALGKNYQRYSLFKAFEFVKKINVICLYQSNKAIVRKRQKKLTKIYETFLHVTWMLSDFFN